MSDSSQNKMIIKTTLSKIPCFKNIPFCFQLRPDQRRRDGLPAEDPVALAGRPAHGGAARRGGRVVPEGKAL